jgi:hypothetical protein
MEMIRSALRVSLMKGGVRFGFDESGRNAIDLRAVVQFPIGAELFDWFFNARTGYRAQFRYGWQKGLSENAHLVTMLRTEIGFISSKTLLFERKAWKSEAQRESW